MEGCSRIGVAISKMAEACSKYSQDGSNTDGYGTFLMPVIPETGCSFCRGH